ncbi:hypothetical protein [Aeromicrobium sp. UC242_57]|uniref:hypothetical protein n=1 Tax=Aeromicrobium sp. UC242_57 TaxID=3374624 RepID=UPI0037AABA3E
MQRRVQAMPSAVKYLVVGAASYAVDLCVLMIAWKVLGLPLWVATAVASGPASQ